MQELTRTEERIMLLIWKLKSAFVKDIRARMPGDQKPPYNTVSSVVRILVRKGFLDYKAYGRTHEYHPLISKSKYRRFKLRKLLSRYYNNAPSSLMGDLLRDEKINKGQLKKIKELMKNSASLIAFISLFSLAACTGPGMEGSFEHDLKFLQKHAEVLVLKSQEGRCMLALVPAYQGRVMTSSAAGMKGKSHGWINYGLIASGDVQDHINVYGGEDRFWLGPEGGQYSIFFEKGSDFTLENWQTPAVIDTEPFALTRKDENSATFSRRMTLLNYAGYAFDLEVEREIRIFDQAEVEQSLGISLDPQVDFVGFGSVNQIRNAGESAWSRESGLLSIWILGMFNPSDQTTIIIPYRDSLALNTAYFGAIGPDRLEIRENTILFKGDGKYRCKIGLPPANVLSVMGSYDGENQVLTIVKYSFSGDTSYVNSLWKLQDHPYGGDVINSYNDGPLDNGEQLGPFYELESSSPARELQPGEGLFHEHLTYHFEGGFEKLNAMAKELLGTELASLEGQK